MSNVPARGAEIAQVEAHRRLGTMAYMQYVEFAIEEQRSKKSRPKAAFLFTIATAKDLAEQKRCRARRKAAEAPTAYLSYVEGVRTAATKICAVYACEIRQRRMPS